MTTTTRGRVAAGLTALAAGAAMLVGGGATAQPAQHATTAHRGAFRVVSVSNPHPSLISGGDVLVRVTLPAGVPAAQVRVSLGGRNLTRAFSRQRHSLLGLVSGLPVGRSRILATAPGHRAHLVVDNHPLSGPVFTGAQQQPFHCQTEAYGLPASTQPDCSVPTQTSYRYFSTDGSFKALASPTARPADLARVRIGGRKVPYVVRLEQGTIDRAVYQIATLYDGRKPGPLHPDALWNKKFVYTFGGGCNAGYHQGTGTGGVLNDLFLSRGYAVASSSLNVLDNNCSPIISAEAAMMVKEHFVEAYGAPRFTIGWGGSGGAIQQYDIAEAYPGILDGIVPSISFTDPFTTAGPVTDCSVLNSYFNSDAAKAIFGTDAQRQAAATAVSGFNYFSTCQSWVETFAIRATATKSCDKSIPVAEQWNADTNPNGVVCNSMSQIINQVGSDPQHPAFARTVLDNVGVQYGLDALRAGAITPDQFAELNAGVGGLDYKGDLQSTRSVGDAQALKAVYADDLYNSASQGLLSTPIIDQRLDLDPLSYGDANIHTADWSFAMRARLQANGAGGNQVIVESTIPLGQPGTDEMNASNVYALTQMDAWLTRLKADHRSLSAPRKIAADRPAALSDGCYLPASNKAGYSLIHPESLTSGSECATRYPIAGNTRTAAGEPTAMPAMKCALAPIDYASYVDDSGAPIVFSDADKALLAQAFPGGVCDWSKPDPDRVAPIATWLDYAGATRDLPQLAPRPVTP